MISGQTLFSVEISDSLRAISDKLKTCSPSWTDAGFQMTKADWSLVGVEVTTEVVWFVTSGLSSSDDELEDDVDDEDEEDVDNFRITWTSPSVTAFGVISTSMALILSVALVMAIAALTTFVSNVFEKSLLGSFTRLFSISSSEEFELELEDVKDGEDDFLELKSETFCLSLTCSSFSLLYSSSSFSTSSSEELKLELVWDCGFFFGSSITSIFWMGSSWFEEEDEDFLELTSEDFSKILSGSSSEELELELDFLTGTFLSFAFSRVSKASTSLDTSILMVSFSISLFEDDDEVDFLELSSEELELDCKRGLFCSLWSSKFSSRVSITSIGSDVSFLIVSSMMLSSEEEEDEDFLELELDSLSSVLASKGFSSEINSWSPFDNVELEVEEEVDDFLDLDSL